MPGCLSNPYNLKNPKRLFQRFLPKACLFICLFFPTIFHGQGLTGLWVGSVSNDSATARKDQSFEIALTEYKEKVYGYSRSEFIVNDTLYYIVKRVKGKIEGNKCEVTDDEIISYNFPGKLDKGVKVTSIFKKNKSDSSWYLDGTWKTNATKKYYSVGGKVNLDEEKDLTASKLFPHLEELNLASEVAFYKERIEGNPIVKLAKPEKINTEYFSSGFIKQDNETPVISLIGLERPVIKQPDMSTAVAPEESKQVNAVMADVESSTETTTYKTIEKPVADLPKTITGNTQTSLTNVKPREENKKLASNQLPPDYKKVADPAPVNSSIVSSKPNPSTTTVPARETRLVANTEKVNNSTNNKVVISETNKPAGTNATAKLNQPVKKPVVPESNQTIKNPVQDGNKEVVIKDKPAGIITTPVQQKPSGTTLPNQISASTKPTIDVVALAANIGGRKSEFTQMVSFKSDSLELSLYDNGEIDGDTVSIFLNGEVVLSKQGLKSTAIRKTIYIQPGQEDFTLVLFAENLGKYPPNTGLLVVHDGEDVYNLRFSSDFQKNAGIIFKRKK